MCRPPPSLTGSSRFDNLSLSNSHLEIIVQGFFNMLDCFGKTDSKKDETDPAELPQQEQNYPVDKGDHDLSEKVTPR